MTSWISLLRRARCLSAGRRLPAKNGSRSPASQSPPYSEVPSHRSRWTSAGRSLPHDSPYGLGGHTAGLHRQPAQPLVTDDGEDQLVAAADAELLQQGESIQHGGDVALNDPGDLALLHHDVREEYRPQLGQPVAGRHKSLDHLRRSVVVHIAPGAHDQGPHARGVDGVEEPGEGVRPRLLALVGVHGHPPGDGFRGRESGDPKGFVRRLREGEHGSP